MYYNSLNRQPYIPQGPPSSDLSLYKQRSPSQIQYIQPKVIRMPSKQYDMISIPKSPLNKYPQKVPQKTSLKLSASQHNNKLSTLTIKNNNHRQYFEKSQLRIIKPINSSKINQYHSQLNINSNPNIPTYTIPNSNATSYLNLYPNLNLSSNNNNIKFNKAFTQSTQSQVSSLSVHPGYLSLNWDQVKNKSNKNIFKFNLNSNLQKSTDSFCSCQEPCCWASRWSNWSKMPKQIIYKQLLNRPLKQQTSNQIIKDLKRTQPTLTIQRRYYRMLKQVLETYSKYDENIGYIQGMNLIVSIILYHVKAPQQTFWILVDIMERRQFKQIYQNQFKKLSHHTSIISKLIKYRINDLHHHLIENGVEIQMILTGWFLSLMFNIIPLKYAHLCLDMFITEGFTGFYKIVMCYLVYLKEEIMCMEDMSDILTRFSSTHNQEKVDWESILEAALRFKITEHDILNLK